MGKEKRGSAIVQAQLIFCNGDKIVARNTRFVSRLNLCPFLGGKWGTGAVFFNCDINSYTRGEQYFTKMGGQVAVIDTRLKSETSTYLGWQDVPGKESRCYQNNFQFNGESYYGVMIGQAPQTDRIADDDIFHGNRAARYCV